MLDWTKMHIYEVLRRPIITEKNAELMARNKYAFEVAREANKRQIKEAVEKAFKVKVTQVNVITVPGKTKGFGRLQGKTSPWKKAIVTLEPGSKIEIFEEV
jgi:large subunit ribosomal protein L23